MYDVKLIERWVGNPGDEHRWREVIAVEVDGKRFDLIPEGSDIKIEADVGGGPWVLTFSVFVGEVSHEVQGTLDLRHVQPDVPGAVDRLMVDYERHIGVPPTHVIPPGEAEPVRLDDWVARQRVSSSQRVEGTDGG